MVEGTQKINWVTVYETQESYDALEVKNLLQEQGLPSRLQGAGTVQVPAKFVSSARDLVDSRPDKEEF